VSENSAKLSLPQTQFWALRENPDYYKYCRFPLLLGGFMSGKSWTKINAGLWDVLSGRTTITALYAPTYDLIKRNDLPRIEEVLQENRIDYKLNKSDFVFNLYGYGEIYLRSMSNPGSIIAYQSGTAHVDEIDKYDLRKAEEAFTRIISRTRLPNKHNYPNTVCTYTTPEGYGFTYNRWGAGDREHHNYVRAPTYSNPAASKDYIHNLRTQFAEHLVDAYLEGRWVNMRSNAVYPMYDKDENDTKETIKKGEPLYIGMDFNAWRMCAAVFVGRGLDQRDPHLVDEIIGAQDTPSMIEEIKMRYPNNTIIVYPDATSKNISSKGVTISDLHMLEGARFIVRRLSRNPLILDRVKAVNAMFCNGRGQRRFKINKDRCPMMSASFEQQVYVGGLPEKDGVLDDRVDAAGYFISYAFPIKGFGFKPIKKVA